METKGKTLEEIDAIFEGEKRSCVPDVGLVQSGQKQIDVDALEHEIAIKTTGKSNAREA